LDEAAVNYHRGRFLLEKAPLLSNKRIDVALEAFKKAEAYFDPVKFSVDCARIHLSII